MNKPFLLVILDGFGYSGQMEGNAIAQAQPVFFNSLLTSYPWTLTQASGVFVGLPDGVQGNSAVGHMTIGCGRIIEQPLTFLNACISERNFCSLPALKELFDGQKGERLHLMGLLSDGNVHSSINHLFALIDCAKHAQIQNIFIHAFLDGRDVSKSSARKYLELLDEKIKNDPKIILGSIHGRFYAMDRDEHWDRTVATYMTITENKSVLFSTWQDALDEYYSQDITDEFIPPTLLHDHAVIGQSDMVVFFNIRADRARQLSQLFLRIPYAEFARIFVTANNRHEVYTKAIHAIAKPAVQFISGIRYHPHFTNPVLFDWPIIKNTLRDVLIGCNKTIFTIAETEKYAHVTYFFNGGSEYQSSQETRIMVPSLPIKTYAQEPQMSARLITDAVITSLQECPQDVYIINYANADMVGHSGDIDATIRAIKCLDGELERLVAHAQKSNAYVLITADHGNAEEMLSEKQHRNYHSNNPVYTIFITDQCSKNKHLPEQLAEVAPFILDCLQLPKPPQMDE